ncbi:MAG TPA: fused MFS/spermidine synthase [Candidatus Limnocylindrales bacterium]|nr:fused MFS/spermidine synthase [Candidatus Limnocylindrales bacterium]
MAELFPDPDVVGAWTLFINGVAQSHVDLNDPQLIAFDYVRRMADIVDTLAPAGPLVALHLGAGAMTLPRCLARMRPGSLQTVVEVDAELLRLVLEYLPLAAEDQELIDTVVGDAAVEMAAAPAREFDVIVADVFEGGKVPAQVGTEDFARSAARALKPGGCYVANIMDGAPLEFARAQAAVLKDAFAEVAVVADAGVLRGRRHGNLLLVAGGPEIGFARLTRRMAADPFAVRVEHGERLDRFIIG